jgi:hypothetical protein
MSALPDHVDIGPFRYTIIRDERARLRMQEATQTLLLGHTDLDNLTVIIGEKMPAGLARETLMHELLHVVCEVTGLHEKWGKSKEERIVRRLSPMLLELLQRNPDLVKYLTAGTR